MSNSEWEVPDEPTDLFSIPYTLSETPNICRALDQRLTAEYGPDEIVAGHLALDESGLIIDVRVYVHGDLEGTATETPYGDGKEAWDDMMAWLESLGTNRTLTFFRRPHVATHIPMRPMPPDLNVFDACLNLQDEYGLDYLGHLITDGTRHANVIANTPENIAEAQALNTSLGHDHSHIEHIDGVDDIDQLLRAIEAGLERTQPDNPFDLPDTNERPDVPPAFYN